jgi:hypothetical protein
MGSVRALRSLEFIASAVPLFLLAACGGDGGSNSPTPPTGTGIAIVAGNFQLARYGTSVPIAPAVKITGANGPVAGVPVTFAPVAGSGSVSGGSVTTDANGVATVGSWTLSPAPGANTLKATAGNLTVSISATAVAGAATVITAKQGDNQNGVERGRVSGLVQVEVTDGTYPVRNVQVDFTVTSGGGSLDVPNQTTNIDGLATLGGWRLGGVGPNTVTATVRGTSLTTVFTANAAALQVSSFVIVDGATQTGLAGNLAPRQATVRVLDQFNNPAEGVPVSFAITGGGGTVTRAVDTTGTDGLASVGAWRLGTSSAQSLTATASATPAPAPLTFTATVTPVPASAFRIEVRYPEGEPSAEIKAAFDAAAAKWSSIVVGDLEDVVLAGTDVMGPDAVEGNACIPLLANQTIDDLVIFAYVRPIDGPLGILGFATPRYVRDNDTTAVSGCMTFDEADLEMLGTKGLLQATITHEMGHVLGIGTLWTDKGLTVGTCDPNTGVGSRKPFFTGGSARQAFFGSLGTGVAWTDPAVPLEGEGTCFNGTRDGHPSETIFVNELMTGYIDPVSNPLSAVSASFLRDLGFKVNDLAADPYTVPYGLAALRMNKAGGVQLNEMHVNPPIKVIDREGRTTRIVER